MIADCLGETGMSLKTKLTRVREKGQQQWHGRDHTLTKRNLTTGKCFSGWRFSFIILIHFFHSSCSRNHRFIVKIMMSRDQWLEWKKKNAPQVPFIPRWEEEKGWKRVTEIEANNRRVQSSSQDSVLDEEDIKIINKA